jgi:hypothetical protein
LNEAKRLLKIRGILIICVPFKKYYNFETNENKLEKMINSCGGFSIQFKSTIENNKYPLFMYIEACKVPDMYEGERKREIRRELNKEESKEDCDLDIDKLGKSKGRMGYTVGELQKYCEKYNIKFAKKDTKDVLRDKILEKMNKQESPEIIDLT